MDNPNRREFLQQSLSALAILGGFSCLSAADNRLAVVIKGARSFFAGKWQTVDIGVTEAGTIEIGGGPLQGRTVIDCSGKVISPGFIDVLTDNRKGPFELCERYKLTDGVTAALSMHGGSSNAGAYYQAMAKSHHWVNYGVSTFATEIRSRPGTTPERLRKAEACLEEGALGVSYAVEYTPIPYSELLEYAKLAKKYDRSCFLHLRYSSKEKELDGVKEAIQLARDCGARVHIDHLHSTGGTYRMKEALELIGGAVKSGLQITCCVYPYSYWATYIPSTRFDPGWQQRYGITYSDLTVVGTGEKLTEASFEKYRKRWDVLVAIPDGVIPMESTVDLALKENYCMIGSDGGIESEPVANNHPRGAGCFATALRHGMDIGIPLEKMIEKMTTLPRSILLPAMKQRGVLENGAMADLVVFDPKTVRSPASVAKPNQFSIGIDTVIVNGQIAYRAGKLMARAGRAVRA
ncbi:MAG: amidohydrolase family protein [Holophagales bacterium]|jgi:N-acyl-D-aspartate/D-glutamate deacylase|nr:amidohydrolase family protein [Holophagales bacterium]